MCCSGGYVHGYVHEHVHVRNGALNSSACNQQIHHSYPNQHRACGATPRARARKRERERTRIRILPLAQEKAAATESAQRIAPEGSILISEFFREGCAARAGTFTARCTSTFTMGMGQLIDLQAMRPADPPQLSQQASRGRTELGSRQTQTREPSASPLAAAQG